MIDDIQSQVQLGRQFEIDGNARLNDERNSKNREWNLRPLDRFRTTQQAQVVYRQRSLDLDKFEVLAIGERQERDIDVGSEKKLE